VVADRYMYTAFARNKLMGADPTWSRSLFGFALVPDLVLYLKVDLAALIPRALEGKGMDYWESGMHQAYDSDLFESFCNYQRRLIREFNALAREFNFITIDARKSSDIIQRKLRGHIGDFLRHKGERNGRPAIPAAAQTVSLTPSVLELASPAADGTAPSPDIVEHLNSVKVQASK